MRSAHDLFPPHLPTRFVRKAHATSGHDIDMGTLSQKQLDELKALSELPDTSINTLDIPDTADWGKAVQGRFCRPGISSTLYNGQQ